MKNSINFTKIFNSALFVIAFIFGLACAWDWMDDSDYRFFSPEVSRVNKDLKPFFRASQYFYPNDYLYPVTELNDVNTEDWFSFFKKSVKKDDINFLLYSSTTGQVDTLIFYLKDNKYPIQPELKKNSILQFGDKNISKAFLFYIGFAKRCEVYTTYDPQEIYDWQTGEFVTPPDPTGNKEEIQKLIDGGQKQIEYAKHDFIKERYVFQILRLYFYSRDYQKCLEYYKEKFEQSNFSKSVKYRAMGYAAGCYYKSKRFSQANYLYSRIFDEYSPMKRIAFRSFHPQEESDWNACLNHAKNENEKCALWAMMGISLDPLRAIKNIYSTNPKSEYLDLLLARAVNVQEESFLFPEIYNPSTDVSYAFASENIDKELVSFIREAAENGNTNKPYLWKIASGYLLTALHDFTAAEKYFADAKINSGKDKLVLDQIRMFEFVLAIESIEKIDEKFEAKINTEFKFLNSKTKDYWTDSLCVNTIYNWSLKRLAEKYRNQNDFVKAQCLDETNTLPFYLNTELKNDMLTYMNKKNQSEFDNFALSVNSISQSDIYEWDAVNYYFEGKLEEAIKKFKTSPESGKDGLRGDPFIIHINDCHDCDHATLKKKVYTKLSFVQRMQELINKAQNESANSSKYYFEIANGFYNTTYFGNARTFYETAIQPNNDSEISYAFYLNNPRDISKSNPVLDCSRAEYYYKLAMENSNDENFKTQCAFMCAKCEQNEFYLNKPENYEGDFKAGKYFKLLKDNFSNTNYYKEIINECGYFRTYIGQK
ncbi:MAG: hypothetical protein V1720_03120 [bacterium]